MVPLPFELSDQRNGLDAAASSVGIPQALQDLFADRIGAGAQIARKIQTDALQGTGVDASGNATLVGLYGGALVTSGSYAGVNTATYSEWASAVIANGGTLRALTADLLNTADQNIFVAASLPWTFAMTSGGVLHKYESLFTTNTQGGPLIRMNDNAGNPQYGMGLKNDGASQLPGALYKGNPIYRNAVNPVNKMVFVNREKIAVKYLPRVLTPQDAVIAQMLGIQGSSEGTRNITATQIPARVAVLAKTGDSIKVSVKVTLAMCVTRPNAFAIVQDINEN